nr:hypothetical protein CPGR_05955 [Mycolicibacterium fortuitum subsp. fortuitum DSM 46621 = ATCC 6841 = JCM 6387]
MAPGRFAPAARPRPLTGAAGAAGASAGASAGAAEAAGAAFLAPGRLAPPAMPRPLTGAAGAAGASAGAADAAGAAAFLAPGRLAPPAMPRPLTGAGAAAGAAGASAAGAASAGAASSTTGAGAAAAALASASARASARFSDSFAAVPFSGSVMPLLSSELSSSWATSSTSAFSTLRAAATSSTPSVIITRQNGQPVAMVEAVSIASSVRSTFTRLPMCSSIHMRAPPAPQHRPRSAWRGISLSVTPEASTSSRGAS